MWQHTASERQRVKLDAAMREQLVLARYAPTLEDRSAAKTAAAVLYVRLYTPCPSLEEVGDERGDGQAGLGVGTVETGK